MSCLLQKVAEETAALFFVHASAVGVLVVLLLADATDFVIPGLRVHEYESAYAGLRYHGVAFGQLDSDTEPSGKHLQDIALHRMVRAA